MSPYPASASDTAISLMNGRPVSGCNIVRKFKTFSIMTTRGRTCAERVDSVRVMIDSSGGGESRGLESKVKTPRTGKHAECGQIAHKPTLGTWSDTGYLPNA